MAKLWFDNGRGLEYVIAECSTMQEVYKAICEFLDKYDHKAPYFRSWQSGERTQIDFGSWSQFFFWDKVVADEEMKVPANV